MLSHYSDYEDTLELLQKIQESRQGFSIEWDKEKNHLEVYEEDELIFTGKLPLIFPEVLPEETLSNYTQRIPELAPNFLIILIQAGNASLGHYEADVLLNHKVVRKYMVRAKQGKAQTGHLKTKGKSRAGSRVRLAQTEEFFDEIVEKLLDWETDDVEYIFYSSAIHWWNALFEAEDLPPFEKQDSRLRKIPVDVQNPNFEELKRIHHILHLAHWQYEETWENDLFPI
jgi:hypothetical protein